MVTTESNPLRNNRSKTHRNEGPSRVVHLRQSSRFYGRSIDLSGNPCSRLSRSCLSGSPITPPHDPGRLGAVLTDRRWGREPFMKGVGAPYRRDRQLGEINLRNATKRLATRWLQAYSTCLIPITRRLTESIGCTCHDMDARATLSYLAALTMISVAVP